jgi:hypothetical protein
VKIAVDVLGQGLVVPHLAAVCNGGTHGGTVLGKCIKNGVETDYCYTLTKECTLHRLRRRRLSGRSLCMEFDIPGLCFETGLYNSFRLYLKCH